MPSASSACQSPIKLDIPPVYFTVALALMALLHHGAPLVQLFAPPLRYSGLALSALGIALGLWAAALFHRAGTGIVPFSTATVLVTSGPYRFTRNPMYLAMALILLGAAIAFGSLSPFLMVPAFIAAIAKRFIGPEEAMLERSFGAPYLDYKARVRRWL